MEDRAISLNAVIKRFQLWYSDLLLNHEEKYSFEDLLRELPPIIPQPQDGDSISRQALQEWIKDKSFGDIVVASEHNFDCLPPVKPQEPKYCDRNICLKNEYNGIGCDECEVTKSQESKTGHWIIKSETSAKCPRCHKYNLFYGDFCKWCGAKMIEPQKSEE